VKDFVREYGKMAGFAALGAFFVSLLVGLVSGNPFGVVLARAFLFAVLFAGLAAGARYIVSKFLPELVGTTPAQEEEAPGQKIDITLPEERPAMQSSGSSYSARTEPARPEDSTIAEEEDADEAASAEEPLTLDSEQQPGEMSDILGDDLDDALPPLSDPDSAQSIEAETPGGRSGRGGQAEGDSVEDAESVTDDGLGGGVADGSESDDLDSGLGRLPDISSLGIPAAPGRVAPQESSLRGGEPPSNPKDAMKGAVGSRDPATLARAIRTVLNRDEKG